MNSRLQNLRKLMTEQKLDAVFISSLPNIFYLTGFSDFSTFERDGYILITKKNQYIFTHGIYKETVEKKVTNFQLIQIIRENPINKAVKEIVEKEKINTMGFEAFDMKVSEYKKILGELQNDILIDTTIINQLRMNKTSGEIDAIKKSCHIGDLAFSHIIKKLKTGVTEIDLAVAMEFFIKQQGVDLSFPTIIAFGPHASNPHHVPTNTPLKKNQFVLFDFGVKYNNYCSDMTRTVFYGSANENQKKAYLAVLEAQKLVVNAIESLLKKGTQGISAKEIDQISRNYLLSCGYPTMIHSLGHGIGIEIHEAPRLSPLSNEYLENGNVFSIEPGIYIPDSFGIRIEDIYAIEEGQIKNLTTAPKNFISL